MNQRLAYFWVLIAFAPLVNAATSSASFDIGAIQVKSLIGGASYFPTDPSNLSFATIATDTLGNWNTIGADSLFTSAGVSASASQSSASVSALNGAGYGHSWTWNLGTATVSGNSVVIIELPYTYALDATGQFDTGARAEIRLLTRPSVSTPAQGYSSTSSFQSDADFQSRQGQSNNGSGILKLALINQSATSQNFNLETGMWVDASAVGLVSAVPEPATYAMMLAGLGLIGFSASRRRQADSFIRI